MHFGVYSVLILQRGVAVFVCSVQLGVQNGTSQSVEGDISHI